MGTQMMLVKINTQGKVMLMLKNFEEAYIYDGNRTEKTYISNPCSLQLFFSFLKKRS